MQSATRIASTVSRGSWRTTPPRTARSLQVSAQTDAGTYRNNTINAVTYTGTLNNGDECWIDFVRTGDLGATGAAGATGTNGTNGTNGSTGATGATGTNGATGAVGQTGATGLTGLTGNTGATGLGILTGVTAPTGGTGRDGDFWIDTAQSKLYGPRAAGSWPAGTFLIGATGSTGATGFTGFTGATGFTGSTGVAGNTGATGLTGATGTNGTTGATGINGATGATGTNGATGNTGATGTTGATGNVSGAVYFGIDGILTTNDGGNKLRIYNDSGSSRTISSVRISVGTAPTGSGSAVTVDIKKDGTSIFGTKPTITVASAAVTNKTTTFATTTTWADGSYLTMNVDTVGTTIAGADLVVVVTYS